MMHETNRAPFIDDRPLEITLDLPMPTSTNAIWGNGRGRTFKSSKYLDWLKEADIAVMASRQFPKRKITGPFEVEIMLGEGRGDGDNRIKALLDWLQSRDIIRNDSDCRRGSWAWVEPDQAPRGCRVVLRSL
jgi:Holliday junction resolvase RusA-like endonuclease